MGVSVHHESGIESGAPAVAGVKQLNGSSLLWSPNRRLTKEAESILQLGQGLLMVWVKRAQSRDTFLNVGMRVE